MQLICQRAPCKTEHSSYLVLQTIQQASVVPFAHPDPQDVAKVTQHGHERQLSCICEEDGGFYWCLGLWEVKFCEKKVNNTGLSGTDQVFPDFGCVPPLAKLSLPSLRFRKFHAGASEGRVPWSWKATSGEGVQVGRVPTKGGGT